MLNLFCPEVCLMQRENQKVITLLFRLLCGKMHHLSGPHLSCCIKQQEQKLTQSFAKKMSMEHRTHSSCRNDTQTVAAIIITTIIITIISTVVSTLLLWIPFLYKKLFAEVPLLYIQTWVYILQTCSSLHPPKNQKTQISLPKDKRRYFALSCGGFHSVF